MGKKNKKKRDLRGGSLPGNFLVFSEFSQKKTEQKIFPAKFFFAPKKKEAFFKPTSKSSVPSPAMNVNEPSDDSNQRTKRQRAFAENKDPPVTVEQKLTKNSQFLNELARLIFSRFAQNPGTSGDDREVIIPRLKGTSGDDRGVIIPRLKFATAALMKRWCELMFDFISAAEAAGNRMSRSTHLWDAFFLDENPNLKETFISLRQTFDDLFMRSYLVSFGSTSQICAAFYQTVLKPFLSFSKSDDACWLIQTMNELTNSPASNTAAREAVLELLFPIGPNPKIGGEERKTVSQQLDGFRLLARALTMFLNMLMVKSVTFKSTGQFVLPPYPGQTPTTRYIKKTQHVNELLRRIAAALLRRALDPSVQADRETVTFRSVDEERTAPIAPIAPIAFESWHQLIGALNSETLSDANKVLSSTSRVPTQGKKGPSTLSKSLALLLKSTFEELGSQGKVTLDTDEKKMIQAVVGHSDLKFRQSANGTATPLSFASSSECFLWMANVGLDNETIKGLFEPESTEFPAEPDPRNGELSRSPFKAACYMLLLWRWYQKSQEERSLLPPEKQELVRQMKLVEERSAQNNQGRSPNRYVLLFLALSVPNLSDALKQFGYLEPQKDFEDEKDESSHYLPSNLLSQLSDGKRSGIALLWPVFLCPIEEVNDDYLKNTLTKSLKLIKELWNTNTQKKDPKGQGSGVVGAPPKSQGEKTKNKKQNKKNKSKKGTGKSRVSTKPGSLPLPTELNLSLSLSLPPPFFLSPC